MSRGESKFVTPHDEKFLIDLFSKRSQGLGAEPRVASAEAKLILAVFGSFCSSLLKKNGNGFLT